MVQTFHRRRLVEGVSMARDESEVTRRVRVVEFRPHRTKDPTSEPRVLIGPVHEPPRPDEARREDEDTRPIVRGRRP
jgi:hypothetical protein